MLIPTNGISFHPSYDNEQKTKVQEELAQVIAAAKGGIYTEFFIETVAAFVRKNKHLLNPTPLKKLSKTIKKQGDKNNSKQH